MISIPALEHLRTRPHALAVEDALGQSSWLEFFHTVRATLEAFSEHGLVRGDHAAVLLDNRREYFAVLLGAVLGGVWITPINRHLTRPEIDHVLADSGAALLIQAPEDERDFGAPRRWSLALNGPPGDAAALYRELLTCVDLPPGGTLMYTSGTTGRPKGVKRNSLATVGQTLANWCQVGAGIGLDGVGVHLVTGPAYHAAPGLYALYDLLSGASLCMMPRWDSEQCLELIESRRITHTHLVPTMFVRLLRERDALPRDYDLSSLRLVLHGAAPVSPEVKRAMIQWWGPVIEEYWGASESGIITRAASDEWLQHPCTVGRPLSQYQLSVRDESFARLPAGEVGTLYARRAGVARPFEYFRDPAKTDQSYVGDWFTLGDMGWLDEAGYAYIADRRSNLIISGGVNIYPAEVEGVLAAHPEVMDVVVVGLDDPEWGKRVHAIVQPVAGAGDGLEESLRQFSSERLAGFKLPRSYVFVEELPRFESGKLYRDRL